MVVPIDASTKIFATIDIDSEGLCFLLPLTFDFSSYKLFVYNLSYSNIDYRIDYLSSM